MKYVFDNDLHIHSGISLCSGDPAQSPAAILDYAVKNGLKQICLTDHFWDENVPGASDWYKKQDLAWISRAKPLPQAEGVSFLFGCETDMDMHGTVGVSDVILDAFDFIIVPTTHLHMKGFAISETDAASLARRAELWSERFDALMDKSLPFHKIGVAHLACGLMAPSSREDYLETLSLIPTGSMEKLFARAARLGIGIELNSSDMDFSDAEADTVLRMFRIAKRQGCRFYFGSDAHHPASLERAPGIFARAIDVLGLTEDDKFHIG